MTDAPSDTPVQPSALKRVALIAGGVLAVLLVLLLGVRVLVATPPGRAIVERSLDGMGLGSLGTLEVSGLRGDPLGRLQIARLAIVDDEGVWIEAEDVALRWRPGSLLHHIAYVEELSAGRLRLLRRPGLGGGSGDGGERTWGFALDALRLPQIELEQPVLGAAAVLSAEASVDAQPDRSLTVEMNVERTDVAGDMLTLRGAIDPEGHGDLDIELVAPAEGPIARLIRLPSQTLRAQAMLTGDLTAGEGRVDAMLGDLPFVVATGQWGEDGAAVNLTAQLSVPPELARLAQRLGPEMNANVIVGSLADGRRPIALDASADGALLRAEGPIDIRRRTAPDGLQVTFATPLLDRLIGEGVLDRASFGPVEASGRVTFGDEIAFVGDINGGALSYDGWSAGQASGPVTLAWSSANARVEADLTTAEVQAPEAIGDVLGPTPQIAGVVAYDYAARQLVVSDARIVAAAGEATGEASWTLGGGPISLRADATIADVSHVPQLASGTGTMSLSLTRQAAGEPIRVEVSGAGQNIVAVSPTLSDLLGASASVDAAFDLADGGAVIERASLQGDRILVEARGGAARATGYDLDVDIALQGPVAVGPFDFDGGATAAARLEGAYDAPSLRLDLRADALAAGPVTFTQPRLRAELADIFRAPSGTLAFDAMTEGGPAALSTEVSYTDGVLRAQAIEGGWRDFQISGEASRGPNAPPSGALTLGGFGGRLAADVRMTMEDGPPRLDLHATLRDQPIADAGVISGLSIAVVGPLDALELAMSARGYAGSEFSLEASGAVVSANGETRLTLTPRGAIGADAVSAPRPWTATFRGGDAAIAAALDAGGGELDVRIDRRNGVTEVAADLTEAPLSLVNLFRPDPALEGRASGSIALRGTQTLEGTTRFTITDARAPDYAPNEHLDASLDLTHGANGADIAFTATDGHDFRARVGGRAPLVVAAWPPIPRFDRDAPVSLSGEATGDVAAIWALAAVPGVVVSGRIEANGSLDGTLRAPAFQGAAAVADGGVEEVRIGLLLTGLQGTVRLQGPRLIIENAQATDGASGRVTGSGEIEFGGEPGSRTRVNVDLTSLRVIHTTDNEAVASGGLVFERDAAGARLSGALTIDSADITPPRGGDGAVAVPILDVVEINRPLDLAPPPGARRTATRLDIRATSERRVFIRTNSLDTEWGFDVTIGGTTAEPRVEGTASLVRGDITLVGEVFEFRQSQIVFDGDPREARIDFTAQRESPDITVTARVTGTAEKPEIALSSSPSYPQDEILARMLFGRTRSDLSPFQAAQLASALASLAGGQGFDLLGPLRQTLGVDRLGVDSVDGRALLSGGRYLAEDVYLEVSGGATGLAEAAIEWEIRPRLELATRFGIARDTSVSIRWRKDY